MKRIKNFIILLVGVIITIFLIKCISKNKTKNDNISNDTINETDPIMLDLNHDGYFDSQSYNYDILCFKDVKQILRSSYTNNVYLVHNNGEIWIYNFSKIFTNNMNTLKLNTKIEEKIDIVLIDSEENLWFISGNNVIKVDTIADTKTLEKNNSLIKVLFRGNELIPALKKNSFDTIYRLRHNENLLVQKDNQLYNYDYVYDYEKITDEEGNVYNPYAKEHKVETGIDLNKENIEYIDEDFIKTTEGYYKKGIINQEEVDKYANVKAKEGYIKLKSSNYMNEIIYMDNMIAVSNDKIYKIR